MASIMIFGDICPDNNYRKLFDVGAPFSTDILKDIQSSPLVIGNLECPATDNDTPILKTGPNLRARPNDLKMLRSIGFDVLSIANNHILDYGINALEETIDKATEYGIKTVGAGSNAGEAAKPLIFEIDKMRIGVISFAEAEFNIATEYSPGANHFDPYTAFDDVKKLKESVDYAIVLYHGGIEHYKYPSPLLQKKCRKFSDSGADLVLCQHSHCIGTIEEFKDGIILYGQGNSAFGIREDEQDWNEGLLVIVDIDSKRPHFRLLNATKEGISYATKSNTEKRLEIMKRDSDILKDKYWIESEWSKFCQNQKALDLPLLYGWDRLSIKLNRILRNRLVDWKYSRKKQMVTMNLLRCEAHHEVIQTILENKAFR